VVFQKHYENREPTTSCREQNGEGGEASFVCRGRCTEKNAVRNSAGGLCKNKEPERKNHEKKGSDKKFELSSGGPKPQTIKPRIAMIIFDCLIDSEISAAARPPRITLRPSKKGSPQYHAILHKIFGVAEEVSACPAELPTSSPGPVGIGRRTT